MKTPTVASLKRVNVENLTNLGAERLAEILVQAAASRPDLKRRLRMELAAEQGADHLVLEIDRRVASLEASRSKVSWRKRASFVGDLDILRSLIAERLAALDPTLALDRMWAFMELARRLGLRVRDRDGALAEIFARGAGDIGELAVGFDPMQVASTLVEALARDPNSWIDWLPRLTATAPRPVLKAALALLPVRVGAVPGWGELTRALADAVGDAAAYRATFSPNALRDPSAAAEVAQRLLAAGDVEEAGRLLSAAQAAGLAARGQPIAPDFGWESAWIDYLEQSGQGEAAQDARWSSFERTLSAERARAFTQRLPDFEDVEAESRAFAYAAAHADVEKALAFLVGWPALPEAARLIAARGDEIKVGAETAELWARRLQARQPAAAHSLLRKAAAAAFRRRDFATCDRLTAEAEAINGT
ncbi:DUF6880 family protein [Phenylobacterium sp.]|uniref:DUF6880 family protein n=1 Tax=Phenylobacterium sp. TaxID=1871053 RepID=UPI0026228045|nr:DUF6880 family protein [Phenylobacterium sp.]